MAKYIINRERGVYACALCGAVMPNYTVDGYYIDPREIRYCYRCGSPIDKEENK